MLVDFGFAHQSISLKAETKHSLACSVFVITEQSFFFLASSMNHWTERAVVYIIVFAQVNEPHGQKECCAPSRVGSHMGGDGTNAPNSWTHPTHTHT
jgi:hypothetical protein